MKKFLLLLLLVAVPAFAELTEAARARLWRDVEAQLRSHPEVIYHNGATKLPAYPGFVISNEFTYPSVAIPQTPADLQVGAATTINFNLAALRKSQQLVLIDQSPEVVAMNLCYYRSLFLAAENPRELLGFLSGLEPERGGNVETMARRMMRGEQGTAAGLGRFGKRLADLAGAGVISEVDAQFALAVASDQVFSPDPKKGQVPVFRNAVYGQELVHWITGLYSRDVRRNEVSTTIQNFEIAYSFAPEAVRARMPSPQKFVDGLADYAKTFEAASFLSDEGFRHVRGLFEKKAVRFAQSTIEDPGVWERIGELAEQENHKLTDVYVSNIPQATTFRPTSFRRKVQSGMARVPRERVVWYEAPVGGPYAFATVEMEVNLTPRGFSIFRWNRLSVCARALYQSAEPNPNTP